VIDENGVPLSASDGVVYRREDNPDEGSRESSRVHFRHETVGGRFEPDGRFAGRHWVLESTETMDRVDEASRRATNRDPTPGEINALKALVDEMMRRAPQPNANA
jgi:hypothetical protein